jgi:glycosyltransferase involved in cell wall biosynthesis
MRVVIATEHRFVRTPDGQVHSFRGRGYSFWGRYLEVFDEVVVFARIADRHVPTESCVVSNGPGVRFVDLPSYHGPTEYVARLAELRRKVRRGWPGEGAVIARVPSQLSALVAREAARGAMPYGVEVISDPWDVFSPGAIVHPLRAFFRWYFWRQLRRQCAGACAAAYVTQHSLQRRYPPAAGAFSTHYSTVELPSTAFVSAPRSFHKENGRSALISVGGMDQLYKGQDILIDAVADCLQNGCNLELVFVGDGRQRRKLEARAQSRGCGDRVRFLGQLAAGDPVRRQLDRADLFVLPSKGEGLPRAMIEAFARALPCVGSTAAGIPELLPPEDMVPPGDPAALARKVREVLGDRQRMARMSARNLAKADAYREDVLRKRRVEFYQYLKDVTENKRRLNAERRIPRAPGTWNLVESTP